MQPALARIPGFWSVLHDNPNEKNQKRAPRDGCNGPNFRALHHETYRVNLDSTIVLHELEVVFIQFKWN